MRTIKLSKELKSEWEQAIQPTKIATEPGSNQHQIDRKDWNRNKLVNCIEL